MVRVLTLTVSVQIIYILSRMFDMGICMVAAVSWAYFAHHMLFILKHCTLMLSICQPDTEGDTDSGNSSIPQTSVNQDMARFVSALWLHM